MKESDTTISETSVIQANDMLLLRLFLKLISNATKHKHPTRSPLIHAEAQSTENGTTDISAADNGQGIDEDTPLVSFCL